MRLILIRHGQTPYNASGALDTARPGAGLTPLGHAQAQALPAALDGERISAIHASVLVRTQLTAAPLAAAHALPVQVQEGIEEIVAGDLELHTEKASITTYLETVGAWIHGDLDRVMPGAEDGHTFLSRYDGAIASIAGSPADDEETVVAFSHGAAIRAWVAIRVGAVGPADKLWLANTGMVTIEGDLTAGWNLVQWREEPAGGVTLPDAAAHDVTGAPAEEAAAD